MNKHILIIIIIYIMTGPLVLNEPTFIVIQAEVERNLILSLNLNRWQIF